MIRATAALAGLLLLGCLTACTTSGKPAPVVTITVPASTSAAARPPASARPSGPNPAAARPLTRLRGTCDQDLPGYAVKAAIGGRAIAGGHAFVVGQPEPAIGRIAYLNCRYGITEATAPPKIEIGISLYRRPSVAAARIAATVAEYVGHGATAVKTTVAGQPATMLTGGRGPAYDVPVLVVADGARTVAVSIVASVVGGPRAIAAADTLATLALQRTGR